MKGSGKRGFWIGMAVTAIFILYAVVKMDWGAVWRSFMNTDPVLAALSFPIFVAGFYLRALRWRYIISPIKAIGLKTLFSVVCIAFMANMLLPARLGEFIRAFLIGKKEKIDISASFATIVVERLFDGFTIMSIFFLLVLLMHVPQEFATVWASMKVLGIVSFALYAVLMAVLLLLNTGYGPAVNLFKWGMSLLPGGAREKVEGVFDSFLKGLAVLSNASHVGIVSGFSIVIWLTGPLLNWVILEAMGLDLPISAPFFLLVAQAFGVMLPSSPGFVGPFHAAVVAALALYGVDADQALAAAIVMHAATFISQVGLGVLMLWVEGIGFSELKTVTVKAGDASDENRA